MARLLALDDEPLRQLEAVLEREGYQERIWNELAELLAAYGLRVIGPWVNSGEIFVVMSKRNIKYEPTVTSRHYPKGDDAAELTYETVARGLARLHGILEAKRWTPDGRARLSTFFITQCLFQFPNVYRLWRREVRHDELVAGSAPAETTGGIDTIDPAIRVVAQRQAIEAMRKMPSDELRFAFQMRAEGYSVVEIAATIGMLPKALENQMGRYRRRSLQADEDGRTAR